MAPKEKKLGILTLSAASLTLLQNSISAENTPSPESAGNSGAPAFGEVTANTSELILEPPHQKDLLRLYADHSSHASHSSHVSGMDGSDYSPPQQYYPPPAVPAPPPPQPATPPPGIAPTDAASTTNSTSKVTTPVHGSYLDGVKLAAAKGSADSQYELALLYLHGEAGCETNVEKAKMLLELSAIQGHEEAKKRLDLLKSASQASN
jgi:hypothetical protein